MKVVLERCGKYRRVLACSVEIGVDGRNSQLQVTTPRAAELLILGLDEMRYLGSN